MLSNCEGPFKTLYDDKKKGTQHEHKRKIEFRIETKRTTSILGAEVYEEWLFGPFRPVVRTSSFHVEDTGSIPVRDRYSFPAAFS